MIVFLADEASLPDKLFIGACHGIQCFSIPLDDFPNQYLIAVCELPLTAAGHFPKKKSLGEASSHFHRIACAVLH